MSTVSQIADAVVARLRTVKPANGYTSDLSSAVGLYRRTPLAGSETLVVFVNHGSKSNPSGSEFGLLRRELPVVAMVVAKGTNADTVVHNAIREIENAFRADPRLGGLARFCTYDYSGHEFDQAEKKEAWQSITINVTFTESTV
ncbi:hypothetical protein [Geopsychrobacter electrodiphilus]|uniref:hypothetical protein n=1 Tax=Geopsychrobacter electrodiphilus TaxID=225196 RepID=UPI00037F43E9|nr:hypothetical protein [Geopsychrobacter electrodiphilus]